MIRKSKGNFITRLFEMSVTWQLVVFTSIISVIGFILWLFPWSPFPNSIDYFALKPNNILAGKYLWTLVLHIFTHGSLVHLLVNMFALVSLGGICERIIGRKRFIWFYVLSGIFAGLLSVVLAGLFGYGFMANIVGSPDVYMVGASGAIFAIAGLFVVLLPKSRFSIIFFPFFSLPAYIMVPLVLFLTWIVALLANIPIGNVAHLGGFIAGLAYGYYLRRKYYKKVRLLQKMFR